MNLVDTDVLIAHLRGVDDAHRWLVDARRRSGRRLACSVVSATELLGGMRSGERREVARLLARLRLYPVTEQVARRAGALMRRYRRSHPGIGLGDYFVAATAEVHGLELATLNVRHFPMFAKLKPPFELR